MNRIEIIEDPTIVAGGDPLYIFIAMIITVFVVGYIIAERN